MKVLQISYNCDVMRIIYPLAKPAAFKRFGAKTRRKNLRRRSNARTYCLARHHAQGRTGAVRSAPELHYSAIGAAVRFL
jgi:hypothetical protein